MQDSKIKRSNMGKLREASRMAMKNQVMVGLDVDHLMTLCLASWQSEDKIKMFLLRFQLLGIFSGMRYETRAELYFRLYEEAQFAGALLGPADPGDD